MLGRLIVAKTCLAVLLCTNAAWAETLSDAWAEALVRNSGLASHHQRAVASSYRAEAARAGRLPQARVRGSYNVRSDEASFLVDPPVLGFDRLPFAQREAALAEAEVKAPLYTSGRITSAIRAAEAASAAACQQTAVTRLDLLLAIGLTYFDVLRAERELEVAEQEVAALSAHEGVVQKKFDQRRVPRNDLLAAQVAAATARQNQLRQFHRLQTVRGRYNRLLSRPVATRPTLVDIQFARLPYTLPQLEEIAYSRRPELLRLQAAADSKRYEAERLLASGRPQVSAVGRYDFQENRFQTPQSIATAAVVIDWQLFEGGRKRRAASAEHAEAASHQRSLEDFRRQVALDLLTAWHDREEATARGRVASQTLEAAQEDLRVARARYANGMAVNADVLDAQSRKVQVQRDVYNARYDEAAAQLRLRHAAGLLEAEPADPAASPEAVETLAPLPPVRPEELPGIDREAVYGP